MNHWFTSPDAPIRKSHLKRFDPLHWTVDFPRGCIASLTNGGDPHGLTISCEFLRAGDLVGLIWTSEDQVSHPAQARSTSRDYSGCVLSFRWQSSGVIALDAVNGPTMTIEATDEGGNPRAWYVRLWNYASGSPTDAIITIDFDALEGGFMLPTEADRVDPTRIDRIFISLVPEGYIDASQVIFATPKSGQVTMSEIACSGAGSVIAINDGVAPEGPFGIATAYDDLYNLMPERIVAMAERLGYRGTLNHYIGMSHYFALSGAGTLDPTRTLNGPAMAWNRDFARAAKARGFAIIWSLSYEILDAFCPDAWKQRAFDGTSAATGWNPPSALVSPANGSAIDFLKSVAQQCVAFAVEAGLEPQVQVGEPWWWTRADGAICLYDESAKAALGGSPIEIANVRSTTLTDVQKGLLDSAGDLLAQSTAAIAAAVKSVAPEAKTLLLAYLPTILDPRAPELKRANLPLGWAKPAFDVLQIEDYEWVTGRSDRVRNEAYVLVEERLGYSPADQHYLSGFVVSRHARNDWSAICAAASQALRRGCAQTFLWALPQVLRDGLTLFGKDVPLTPFDDVEFPIAIGAEASVAPSFSTSIVTSASGHESRNANWSQGRLRFDAGPGVRGDGELEALIAFFRARRGPAVGFRFRDPYDHSSNRMSYPATSTDQRIGTGDGATTRFALTKTYGDGEIRQITRPVRASVRVSVDGTELVSGWTLEDGGIVELDVAPPEGVAVCAGFLFDVPVRFAEDRIEINRATFQAGEAPSIPLIEIREGL